MQSGVHNEMQIFGDWLKKGLVLIFIIERIVVESRRTVAHPTGKDPLLFFGGGKGGEMNRAEAFFC